MSNITHREDNGNIIISITGRVDSTNANDTEVEINNILTNYSSGSLVLDFENLEYVSSAGLRIILRLKKSHPELIVKNVSSEVYEILEMTGFTEMMTIEKAFRRISVDGCEVLGQGSNGIVYRIDKETIAKVYKNPDSLDDIKHEREVARKALILGIPTAISYDIVRVGNSYASVFELIDSLSFTQIINADPSRTEELLGIYVSLLKQIHATEVPAGDLPDQKKVATKWVKDLHGKLPENTYEKLLALVEAVPDSNKMIHGDYHTKNLMMQNGEVVMIDMDTLSVGNPIFEFAPIYLAYTGFGELDHSDVTNFIGIDWETAQKFREESFRRYLGTDDPKIIEEYYNKARLLGHVRLLRRTLKRNPDNTALIEHSKKIVLELTDKLDSIAF